VAITKTTTTSIKDASVEEANINNCAATNTKLGADAVTSAKINNGTVTTDDLASTLDLSSKTITLPSSAISFDREYNNIGLLGFKMAVNESLTVFNLVDGVVDEFNDESGTDEAEGSNDNYCGTDDFYKNQSNPASYSAGFSMTAITEPDTSVAGTNPYVSNGTFGSFTVPLGMTSASLKVWGSGGSAGFTSIYGVPAGNNGGGGGFASGTLAVTPGQVLYMSAGEGGVDPQVQAYGPQDTPSAFLNGGDQGGGLSGVFGNTAPTFAGTVPSPAPIPVAAPQVYLVAGSGGARGFGAPNNRGGGAGGGLIGDAGSTTTAQNSENGEIGGGGGSQTQGGIGVGPQNFSSVGEPGGFLAGGEGIGGGAGYYGGGGGGAISGGDHGAGGGGSSYYGHPQITCGSTEDGQGSTGGGISDPAYVPGTNEGGTRNPDTIGEDGYVLLTGTSCGVAISTTIVSEPFTSTSVATSARIVVFEENIDTPTLNTDIVASISRDGTNFTNATLTDSGYVTGSSGQRILTGQADISGQPSGQSMRWKLALANNAVKIHGVSLSWA
jgi:hypothetical protein